MRQNEARPNTRAADFASWYQWVIKEADMAENSAVRGCMIIKPWGYAIWELLQKDIDGRIKEAGHVNCYFPLFIPLSLIQRELTHVAGFAQEMAVVTHHRVVADESGKLVPSGELEEPLVVRPTSETIIGEALSSWIQSYRDLPLLLNQWANVVRWEMRPRLFLRTTEFLWQEGHTAHSTQQEAEDEQALMLSVYADVMEEVLAIPSIKGEKSPAERFPGAVTTFSVEAMMQDGKALQAGTSHNLGQNFAKAANIRFQTKQGGVDHPFTTSWGVSSRLIGAMIMSHGDDYGLRVPPRVAPQHIVIVPILRGDNSQAVLDFCDALAADIRRQSAFGSSIRCAVDRRDTSPSQKRWEWIKKGVPLVCEIGARDIAEGVVTFTYRNNPDLRKEIAERPAFIHDIPSKLALFHKELLELAKERLSRRTVTGITEWEELVSHFGSEEKLPFDVAPAFVRAKWSGAPGTEEKLKELGLAIRNMPFDQSGTSGGAL